jgi:hypothetical protein
MADVAGGPTRESPPAVIPLPHSSLKGALVPDRLRHVLDTLRKEESNLESQLGTVREAIGHWEERADPLRGAGGGNLLPGSARDDGGSEGGGVEADEGLLGYSQEEGVSHCGCIRMRGRRIRGQTSQSPGSIIGRVAERFQRVALSPN